jgi:HlyD family secretion protein
MNARNDPSLDDALGAAPDGAPDSGRNHPAGNTAVDVAAMLDEPPQRRWWKRPTLWAGVVVLLVAIGAGWAWQSSRNAAAAPSYVTDTVQRGQISVTVSANGTLQPTRSVNIGSELSGTVAKVLVDVNDRVTKGQVLVELDTAKLRDQIVRSRAALAAGQAQVAQAAATLKEAQANLGRLEEVSRLSGGKVPSASELDSARATQDRARADEASARATVASARAQLSTDETNLSKASIRSPMDGVVLTRTVDPGNAVAASLQAVTLFTIAGDLTQLRLQVNVDETDVGTVKDGQPATFTVGAYPNRRYPATVTRVAFGSTTTDNVVTYTTYLDVNNQDLSLRPGMTAVSTIRAEARGDALLVPNTALRFVPTTGAARAADGPSLVSRLVPRAPAGMGGRRSGGGAANNTPAAGATRQLWLLREGQPVAVNVTVGATDGRRTEVSGNGIAEGDAVITDQRSSRAKS